MLSSWAEPFMAFVGLPGKAALPLILGNLVNLYTALGAAAGLGLTAREMSILGLILLTSHNHLMEGAVISRVRRAYAALAPLRFVLGVLMAHWLHRLL